MAHQQPQQQQQRKKRVEWSSNLSSSQPQPTENRSPMWDSESRNSGVPHSPPTQFTTTNSPPAADSGSPLNLTAKTETEATLSERKRPSLYSQNKQPHHGLASSFNAAIGGTGSAERRQDPTSMEDDDEGPKPPSTPALQHYFPSSSNKHKGNKSSQSLLTSSSAPSRHLIHPQRPTQPYQLQNQQQQHQQRQADHIESMAANFLGAVASHAPHENHPSKLSARAGSAKPLSPHDMDEVSPISPAGWIGPDHEPMLFPAPDAAAAKARQSHLEWLQQINAMAHQASSTASSTRPTASMNSPAPPYMVNGMAATHGAVSTTSNNERKKSNLVDHEMPTVNHPIPSGAVIPPANYQQHPLQHAAPSRDHSTGPQSSHSAVSFPPPGVSLHPTAAAALAAGNPLFFSHAAAYLRQQASSPVETEEKRAKRLERNRESARKSRLRKKERLSTLGEQVSKLLTKLEKERRIQMSAMDDVMMRYERETIVRIKNEYDDQGGECNVLADDHLTASLEHFVDRMGDPIRKDIVEFQYTALSQHFLPKYQKLMLWMTLHPETYFMVGKEEHAKLESNESSSTARTTPGKISSKQIGDELTNGRKLEDGTIIPPSPSPSSPYPQESEQSNDSGEKAGMTAQAFDAGRMWPLTCFELSISVDQEDKFLQAHKRVRQYENYQRDSSQIAAAARMASSLKEALLYQLFVSSFRKRKVFLEILTPRQAILYLQWSLSSRERCTEVLDERKRGSSSSLSPKVASPIKSLRDENNLTLEALCRSLEEILKITKGSPSSSSLSDQAS